MRIDGATLQKAGAIAWGTGIVAAFGGHMVPTDSFWGELYWSTIGVVMLIAVALILGLGVVKLIGDAVCPEWIDRWWDLTR